MMNSQPRRRRPGRGDRRTRDPARARLCERSDAGDWAAEVHPRRRCANAVTPRCAPHALDDARQDQAATRHLLCNGSRTRYLAPRSQRRRPARGSRSRCGFDPVAKAFPSTDVVAKWRPSFAEPRRHGLCEETVRAQFLSRCAHSPDSTKAPTHYRPSTSSRES